MNLPFTSIVRNDKQSWTFTWTGSGVFRVVLFGKQLALAQTNSYIFKEPGFNSYPPPIEVVASNELADSELYPGTLRIQWYHLAGATVYQIDELIGSTWQQKAFVNETGKWLLSYLTPSLPDQTQHTYRLRAGDDIGQFSDAREFYISVVTPPVLVENSIQIRYDQSIHSIIVTGV